MSIDRYFFNKFIIFDIFLPLIVSIHKRYPELLVRSFSANHISSHLIAETYSRDCFIEFLESLSEKLLKRLSCLSMLISGDYLQKPVIRNENIYV